MKIFADSDPTFNPINEFFKNYGMWIAIALACLIAIALLILCFIAFKKRKESTSSNQKSEVSLNNDEFISSLGGKDNILTFTSNGSRLTIEVKNNGLIDEIKLNNLGVDSVIKMSNKVVLVIKNNMTLFIDSLNN